jgi:hypothetical protein
LFYGQIGFSVMTPATAPTFLIDRVANYVRLGLDVLLMVRSA